MGLFFIFEIKYKGKFYPGININNTFVSGKNFEEIMGMYSSKIDKISFEGIKIIIKRKEGEKEIRIPMYASGKNPDEVVEYFSFGDWKNTIKKGYEYGRTGGTIGQLFQKISILFFKPKNFNLPVVYQNEAMDSFYYRELKSFLKEPLPATFLYKNSKVSISKEMIGEKIDKEEIKEEITKKLTSLDTSPILIKTTESFPDVTEEKLSSYLPLAKEISQGINITFKYSNYEWSVSGKKLITWLTLNKKGRLAIDPEKLEAFLYGNIIPIIDNPPISSRFEIINGKLTETFPGKNGNMVDVLKTVAKTERAIFGMDRSLGLKDKLLASVGNIAHENFEIKNNSIIIPIEITETPPKVTLDTILEYEIRDIVGSSTTNFKGSSEDRIYNIKTGVSKITGRLIAPNEEFSTVFAIGTTSEQAGFLKEFVIKDNRSVKESGGGLCQIATTLFRLALDAGLPITERVNHRYVVGYYGAGLDATIYDPHPDFRFLNDTNNYLLLQGEVVGNEITFKLFGLKDGRKVSISKPTLKDEKPAPEVKYFMSEEVQYATMECSETPRKGITAEVKYKVEYRNGETKEQTFKSVYQPWGKICLIGLKKTN